MSNLDKLCPIVPDTLACILETWQCEVRCILECCLLSQQGCKKSQVTVPQILPSKLVIFENLLFNETISEISWTTLLKCFHMFCNLTVNNFKHLIRTFIQMQEIFKQCESLATKNPEIQAQGPILYKKLSI